MAADGREHQRAQLFKRVLLALAVVVVGALFIVFIAWAANRHDHIEFLREQCAATGGTWVSNYTSHECLRGGVPS